MNTKEDCLKFMDFLLDHPEICLASTISSEVIVDTYLKQTEVCKCDKRHVVYAMKTARAYCSNCKRYVNDLIAR